VHGRERLAGAPLDGAAARNAVVRLARGRSRRAERQFHALDALEPPADETLAPCDLQMEVAGPQRRRHRRLHRALSASGAEAPLRVHALRREQDAGASSWRAAAGRRPGRRAPRAGDGNA